MGTSFKILMTILGVLAAMNMLISYNQKPSKVRTFGVWFNAFALCLIAIALIIDLVINWVKVINSSKVSYLFIREQSILHVLEVDYFAAVLLNHRRYFPVDVGNRFDIQVLADNALAIGNLWERFRQGKLLSRWGNSYFSNVWAKLRSRSNDMKETRLDDIREFS